MTSFCFQMTRTTFENLGVPALWKVKVEGKISPEVEEVIKIVS